MAYVYSGDIYRGGAEGVTSDFGLRDYFAQLAGQSLSAGQNQPTKEQIERARGDFGGALSGYQNLMNNGMYSADDMSKIQSAQVQQINNTTQAMQQNLNNQLSQRGLGGNAGAAAALGMQGQFQAAGQRGQVGADLAAQQAQSKMQGLAGYGQLSGQMAQYAAMPTRQDPNSQQYMDLYDKWRNKQVGYDGAKWGSAPGMPDFYGSGASGSGSGNAGNAGNSASNSFTGTAVSAPAKRYNYVY